jgi:hypothetical protein
VGARQLAGGDGVPGERPLRPEHGGDAAFTRHADYAAVRHPFGKVSRLPQGPGCDAGAYGRPGARSGASDRIASLCAGLVFSDNPTMERPTVPVVKVYPPRGPLQQFRFARPVPFRCFRCGHTKVSKLQSVYAGDWDRVLCNACYGRLLAIYNVKAGTLPDDERAEQLAQLLLELVEAKAAEAAFLQEADLQRLADELHPISKRFIGTAEAVAKTLTAEPQLDWSPAIIGLCKAFEFELIVRLIERLREMAKSDDLSKDCLDKDIGRVARYCAGRQSSPPEIGAVSHFITTAVNSIVRAEQSPLIRKYRILTRRSPKGSWLESSDGLVAACTVVTKEFRNPAAHIDEMDGESFLRCKEFLLGKDGALWKLVQATS